MCLSRIGKGRLNLFDRYSIFCSRQVPQFGFNRSTISRGKFYCSFGEGYVFGKWQARSIGQSR